VAAATSSRRATASGVCDTASACSRLVTGEPASSELSSGRTWAILGMSRRSAAKSGIGMPRTVALGPVRVTQGRSSRSDQLELVRSQPADANGPREPENDDFCASERLKEREQRSTRIYCSRAVRSPIATFRSTTTVAFTQPNRHATRLLEQPLNLLAATRRRRTQRHTLRPRISTMITTRCER